MRIILSFIISLLLQIGFSQTDKPLFLSINPKGGFLFAHRPFMSHLVRQNSYAFEMTVWQQENHTDAQTLRLKSPLKGLAIDYRNFGYDEVLGKSISIIQYMVFPLYQTKKNLCFDLALGSGIGYITKRYDKYENPTNNAIGSALNARVNIKFSLIKYTEKMHFGGGVEFAHYSNGAIKNPNLGLNSPSAFLQVGYNFSNRVIPVKDPTYQKPKTENPQNISVELIFTGKEIGAIPYNPKLYPVVAGRLAYTYSKRDLWGAEFAIDFIHNEANFHKYIDTTFARSDILQVGIYAGTYVQFYKSQIAFGLGCYIRDVINPEGRFYNRIGYRYYFNKKWFGMFNIKAIFGKADYFEFGIGYRFMKW